MNDPHVVALNYTVKTREWVTFANPPPVEHETGELRARLARGKLRVEPVGHHADVELARAAVEPFLRAWEMDAALAVHRREFWFEFEDAEVIDRAPTPGRHVSAATATVRMSMSATATMRLSRAAYPSPPDGFVVTERVRQLWDRYEASIDDREPAPSAGYYCYTALKALAPAGTRKGDRVRWVAAALKVDTEVLGTLNNLTNVGDYRNARKYSPQPRTLTGEETDWIRMAIRVLTRRLGQWESDHTAALPRLSMDDLPPLPAPAAPPVSSQ